MSDRIMGIIFISLMTVLLISAFFLVSYFGGQVLIVMVGLYFWCGFLVWIVCLPESFHIIDFMELFFLWYFVIVWIAIINNGDADPFFIR